MGDQLEQFIMNNKDSFNDVDPSDKVWKGINKKLRKDNGFLQVAWKVAAVLFMVSTLYLLIDKNLQDSQVSPQFSEEFRQAEDYYTQLISQKKLQIQEELTLEEQGQLLEEIDQLDVLYVDLKKTYQTQASSDLVLDAMVSNLQLRLQILSKQLDILENIKDQNDEIESNTEI